MTNPSRQGLVGLILISLITFVGALVWELHLPICIDDFSYKYIPISDIPDDFWDCKGPEIKTVDNAIQACFRNYGLTNGRLSNYIHILFQPFNRNIEAFCAAIAIALLPILMTFASGWTKKGNLFAISISTLLMWITFPWWNGMQSLVYQVNYVWTSCMLLGLIIMLPKHTNWSNWSKTAFLLYSFATGMMHEGFTNPLVAWVFFQMIANGLSKRNIYPFAVIIALLGGETVNLFGGLFSRLNSHTSGFSLSELISLAPRYILHGWSVFLAITLTIIAWRKKTVNDKSLIQKSIYPLFGALIIGYTQALVLAEFTRALWVCDLFAILIILKSLKIICHKNTPIEKLVFCTFTILYIAWLSSLCSWQKKLSSEYYHLLSQWQQQASATPDKGDVVFQEIIHTYQVPMYLLQIAKQLNEDCWQGSINQAWFVRHKNSPLTILPSYLNGTNYDQWPRYHEKIRGQWPMLVSTDSIPNIEVTVGIPNSNMAPINRCLAIIQERGIKSQTTFPVRTTPFKIILPDGSSAYRLFIDEIPLPMQRRDIISIKPSND